MPQERTGLRGGARKAAKPETRTALPRCCSGRLPTEPHRLSDASLLGELRGLNLPTPGLALRFLLLGLL
eukprot:7612328-Alexandrium_andersonii.AAC.1